VFAEEWGFRGGALLLAAYAALCFMGLKIAAQARDRHGAFLAVGAVALIFWHTLVNIGMVTGLLPVVGVTLPFMSYGRSSGLTTVLAIGVLANVGARRRTSWGTRRPPQTRGACPALPRHAPDASRPDAGATQPIARSSASASLALGWTPMIWSTGLPSLKMRRVGIERMP